MSDNQEFLRIHFAWIEYCIEERRVLRENLLNANESKRFEIITHQTLYNTFLLKRLKNFTFSNKIYFKILNDREIILLETLHLLYLILRLNLRVVRVLLIS